MLFEAPTIEQIQSQALLAGFNEKQQAYFDKLIAEYLKQFRGVKDADLKARFDQGDREALSIMRAMIAKRDEIIDFINTKKIKEHRDKENEHNIKVGSQVYVTGVGVVKVKSIDFEKNPPTYELVDSEGFLLTQITSGVIPFDQRLINVESVDYHLLLTDKWDVYSVGEQFCPIEKKNNPSASEIVKIIGFCYCPISPFRPYIYVKKNNGNNQIMTEFGFEMCYVKY